MKSTGDVTDMEIRKDMRFAASGVGFAASWDGHKTKKKYP